MKIDVVKGITLFILTSERVDDFHTTLSLSVTYVSQHDR